MTENAKHSLDTSFVESPNRPSKIPKTEDFSDEQEEEDDQVQESSVVAKPMSPNPRLQRYLIAVEYIGNRFAGSQKQLNARTVVGVLEEAFHKFIGQPVSISLSSRTLPPHEPAVVRRAVNHFLQKNEGDITLVDVRCVPADFHARFKARERTYFYRFLSGPEPLSTFEKDRAWHVPEELDLVAMKEACKVLVGHHDFSSFRASGCQAKSPIRTLDELSVSEVASTPYFPSISEREKNSSNGNDSCCNRSISNPNMIGDSYGEIELGFGMKRKHRCFVVTARARSFLYHQVRLLVGVLKSVGTGNLTSSDVERILNAKSLAAASPMAPACGLYLGHVKYDLP